MRKNMNIELLRIISILMVILVHVYSDFMVRGLYYKSSTVLYVFSFFKICVPLFLIIMGYLYNPDTNIKKVWKKNIFRIIIPLIFFSIFYNWFNEIVIDGKSFNELTTGFDLIKEVFFKNTLYSDAFHLWYLYAIIGIYLLYPVFKVICRNEKLLLYLVIIGFIFTILIPTITGVFPDTAEFLQNFDYGFSYIIFYFLLGNYLEYLLPKISVNNYLFLLLYFIFIIINCVFAKNFDIKPLKPYLYLTSFSYQSVFISLAAICFFIFIMKLKIKENKLIIFLGDKTLIIYYVHLLFLNFIMANVMKKFVVIYFSFSELVSYCFLMLVTIYVLSLIIAIMFKLIAKFFKKIKI